MAPFNDFIHVTTGPQPGASSSGLGVASDYFHNGSGQRWSTQTLLFKSLRENYPTHHITVVNGYAVDLFGFGRASEDVVFKPCGNSDDIFMTRRYQPPSRRFNDENGGHFSSIVNYGCFDYIFKGQLFLLCSAECAVNGIGNANYHFILTEVESEAKAQEKADALIKAASNWSQELHGEVLVFDQGFWQKDRELWLNIQKAYWEDVILEQGKKEAIMDDILGFFDSQEKYEEFNVPWKRGIIFYGPPGNGKTISTKALMHDLSKRKSPTIETLYVKTLASFAGPEYSIRQIFVKARQMAPCLLIFEDIDSLIGPGARSYFLNEVDGLESNHGILMIGSTNHLERLDPGIAKRPSRFDRKYMFDNPTRDERVQYSDYWRTKLKNNKKIDFPKEMNVRIAGITDDFSFAYMKEAFVAALLVIVRNTSEETFMGNWEDPHDPLKDNILWKEIARQVVNLRKEMEENTDEASSGSFNMGALGGVLDERNFGQDMSRSVEIGQSGMPRYV